MATTAIGELHMSIENSLFYNKWKAYHDDEMRIADEERQKKGIEYIRHGKTIDYVIETDPHTGKRNTYMVNF